MGEDLDLLRTILAAIDRRFGSLRRNVGVPAFNASLNPVHPTTTPGFGEFDQAQQFTVGYDSGSGTSMMAFTSEVSIVGGPDVVTG